MAATPTATAAYVRAAVREPKQKEYWKIMKNNCWTNMKYCVNENLLNVKGKFGKHVNNSIEFRLSWNA